MKKINHLLSARKTLKIEAKGIENLSKNLSKEFNEVCDSLLKAKGKIFTLGIGKSGHIAKKYQPLFPVQDRLLVLSMPERHYTEILVQ